MAHQSLLNINQMKKRRRVVPAKTCHQMKELEDSIRNFRSSNLILREKATIRVVTNRTEEADIIIVADNRRGSKEDQSVSFMRIQINACRNN